MLVQSHSNIEKLVAIQDSSLSETGSQYIFRGWIVPILEQGDRSTHRH